MIQGRYYHQLSHQRPKIEGYVSKPMLILHGDPIEHDKQQSLANLVPSQVLLRNGSKVAPRPPKNFPEPNGRSSLSINLRSGQTIDSNIMELFLVDISWNSRESTFFDSSSPGRGCHLDGIWSSDQEYSTPSHSLTGRAFPPDVDVSFILKPPGAAKPLRSGPLFFGLPQPEAVMDWASVASKLSRLQPEQTELDISSINWSYAP